MDGITAEMKKECERFCGPNVTQYIQHKFGCPLLRYLWRNPREKERLYPHPLSRKPSDLSGRVDSFPEAKSA